MSKINFKNGLTSNKIRVFIPDTTSLIGAGKTGLTFSSSGLIISTIADNEATATTYTQAGSTIETISTLGTFAAPTATKCRFKEVDATNHPGIYEIQIADARFAVSGARSLIISMPPVSGLGIGAVRAEIQLEAVDNQDSVRAGLTALPNAAAEAAGGLFTRGSGAGQITQDANGRINVNLLAILGTTLTETAGLIAAGFKQFFNIATPTSTMNTITTVTTTTTATNLTNAPTTGDLTATMKTSVTTAASAATPAVTVSDKTGFSLSTAGILAIWHQLTSAIVTASTIGKLLVDNIDAAISTRTKPADTQAAVTLVATTTNLTNAPTAGDLTATMKASVTTAATAATPAVTVSDKTGFSLSSGGVQAIWDALTSALTTTNSIGKLLVDKIDTVLSTIYSRIGAPVGASISADIAAVKSDTAASQTSEAAIAGYLDTEVAAIKAKTDLLNFTGTDVKATLDGETVTPADGSITAAVIATDAIDADAIKADAVTEFQSGLSTLTASGIRSAIGLSSANLDTQLAAIDDYIDTEVAAIKAKTDLIPSSPAAVSDIPTVSQTADGVWDELLSGHSTTGSAGKKLTDAAAGGGGATAAQVWAYNSRTLTSNVRVTVISPHNPEDNRLYLVRGDSYDERPVVFEDGGNWPDLSSADIVFNVFDNLESVFTAEATASGDDPETVTVPLTSEQTADLVKSKGRYNYTLVATIDDLTYTLAFSTIDIVR